MRDTDLQLLVRYRSHNAEDAFAELVRRHLDLVFCAALRQVRSVQLAEEVAQSVFTDLARSAQHFNPDTILTAWLYQVTRRTAIEVVRRETRRQQREVVASELAAMNAPTTDWTRIEPFLDEAMQSLDDADRAAVLLRYFENKSLREVGLALGASDDAAQKRVSRAVERLRDFFAKDGLNAGASGLAALLSANAVQAAPAGLAVTISNTALFAVTSLANVPTVTATKALAMTTLQKAAIVATLVTALGAAIYEVRHASILQREVKSLRQQQPTLPEPNSQLLHEGGEAALQLAALRDENDRLKRDARELPRLRGRVAALQQAQQESSARLPEDDPEFKVRREKMDYLGCWGLALKVYARTNSGQLPSSLAEAVPSMPNPEAFFNSVGSRYHHDLFEMVYQGSVTNLEDPSAIIVVREKAPVRVSNGTWVRAYLFADGHTETRRSDNGDFKAWEQEHTFQPTKP